MKRCPICGRYMYSHIEMTSGGWRTVWKCICGYSDGNRITWYSDRTETYVKQKRNEAIWLPEYQDDETTGYKGW